MRYTECRMAPLALEMVRDITRRPSTSSPTTTGAPGADDPAGPLPQPAGQRLGRHRGRHGHQHPAAQPARGRRRARWALEHPDATREELQDALVERIKGPDFPNGALIVGPQGIEQAYRTGAARSRCAAIRSTRDTRAAPAWITELPYMVNPDNLALKIAELADSGSPGHRRRARRLSAHRAALVVVLKRDAVARVVLNNLFKHTELRTSAATCSALCRRRAADLSIDQFIATGWRTRSRSSSAHPLRSRGRSRPTSPRLVKALDALDEVIALIRRSPDVDEARAGLMALLEIDEIQAQADPRHAAAPARGPRAPEDHRPLAELELLIADLEDILADARVSGRSSSTS
jgi:DNA gyrase subunit A